MSDHTDEQAVVCFEWETYWPHALLDPANVPTTTDQQSVTCAACVHALGSQKHEPPAHTHNGKRRYPHCRGCGTAYCKTCDAYGDHLSTEPHPRLRPEVAAGDS